MKPSICSACRLDPVVFCPRDTDGRCLICEIKLCAAHMIEHWHKVHFIALDLTHCSTKKKRGPR